MRRIGAAAVLAVCVVAVAGQASAVDPPPAISIDDATIEEGGTATFKVRLSVPDPDNATTVKASTSGSAGDYTARTDVEITFAPSDVEEDFTVETSEDGVVEGNDTFTVTLSDASANAVLADDHAATGTITNDDTLPTVSIAGATSTVTEGQPASFTITLSASYPEPVSVVWTAQSGSAIAGTDFPNAGGTETFSPGQTTKTVVVNTTDDGIDEDQENFTVNLSSPSNATIASGQATGTITDNDNPPSAAVNDISVAEGNDPTTTNAVFTVTLNAASGREVRIPWSTAPGTATAPGDYQATSGTVVFAPGETTGTITVVVEGDNVPEENEKFSVVLVNPTNATLADNLGEATITNDDSAAAPTIAPASRAEGNAGLTDLVFQVTLAGPHPQTTFTYRTIAGSATSSDYTEVGGAPLVFPAASESATLPVTIKVTGDALDENDESLTLQLLNPTTGAVVASAIGTIVNDDHNSKLAINDVSADEPTSGTATMTFTITLAPASARAVAVSWGTANGTGTAGADYTAATGSVSFAPFETSKQIAITVLGDTVNEANETVLVNLSGASGAGVVDGQGQGTIVDKNAPPSLSISDAPARESAGAEFTVTLAGNTLQTVTVRFGTNNGTANAASDYVARVGTLTFAPGEKTKTLEVTVLDDTLSENAETFSVGISDPVNATITKSQGTATIEASDQVTPVGRAPAGAPRPPTAKKTPAKTLLPRMILGPASITVKANGVALMRVTCAKASPIACVGLVALQTTVKPKFQLGTKKFAAKKGKRTSVQIRLSARALKRLMKTGTLKARAIVIVRNSRLKRLRFVPGVVTLKASKALATKFGTTLTLDVKPTRVKATDDTTIETTATPKPKPKATPKPTPKPKSAPVPGIVIGP